MDLNELAFQRLKELKPKDKEIIPFTKIWIKICTNFSIKKKYCWDLLYDFEEEGRIEFVKCHGIRILKNT
jgi:hypothetical protein